MFLHSDNLRKKKVSYTEGKAFFRDKNGAIPFEEVEAFFVSSVNHYTNSVYEGHEYILTLALKGAESYYVLEASTPCKASYALLCRLHGALQAHVSRRITEARGAGHDVVFPTYGKKWRLILKKDRLIVDRLKGRKDSFDVRKIVQSYDGQRFKLIGDTHNVSLFHEHLANSHAFFPLVRGLIPFERTPKSQVSTWLARCGVALVLAGALNHWLRIYQGGFAEECISAFSVIIFGVWVFTAPVFYLVGRRNEKKMLKDLGKRM